MAGCVVDGWLVSLSGFAWWAVWRVPANHQRWSAGSDTALCQVGFGTVGVLRYFALWMCVGRSACV